MIVVGIDPSLTSTGIAVVGAGRVLALERVRSSGRADATWAQRSARIAVIAAAVIEHAHRADLVVIEGPSYGQARQGGVHDRAGLWWAIVAGVGVPLAVVPPACRAKYAAGAGNAGKDAVLAAVIRRYPAATVDGNDVADALAMAAMGARHLGQAIEASLPAASLAAMASAAWPAHPAGPGQRTQAVGGGR